MSEWPCPPSSHIIQFRLKAFLVPSLTEEFCLPFLTFSSFCHSIMFSMCVLNSLALFKYDVWVSSFLKCSGNVTEGPVVRWGQSGQWFTSRWTNKHWNKGHLIQTCVMVSLKFVKKNFFISTSFRNKTLVVKVWQALVSFEIYKCNFSQASDNN